MTAGRTLLVEALLAAVPMWIDRVGRLAPDERKKRATICGDAIAERGDVLMPSYEQRGETAKSFNLLAEGMGVLAHLPGGVEFAGFHWCAGSGHNGVRGLSPCTEEVQRVGRAAQTRVSVPEQLLLFGAAS